MTDSGRQWYVVATRPRMESAARENLQRQGYGLCLPEIRLRNAGEAAEGPLPFAAGDSVRIVRVPFAGLEATYQMRRGEERVQVLLALPGREHSVGVNVDDLAV